MNKKSIVAFALAGTLCLSSGLVASAVAEQGDNNVATTATETELKAARLAVETSKDELKLAQDRLDKAQTEFSSATRAHADAKQALENAISLRDSIQRGEKTQPLKDAELAVQRAQDALREAQVVERDARAGLSSARTANTVAERKLAETSNRLAEAKRVKAVTDQQIEDVRRQNSSSELISAKSALATAQQKLSTAKNAKDAADAKASAAVKTLSEAQQAKTAADQQVKQAEQALANAPVDEKSLHALGFFTYLAQNAKTEVERKDAQAAVKVFQESNEFVARTNMGADNDATSLKNIERSLDMIDIGNERRTRNDGVRKKPGTKLQALKVNHELMAESQVVANFLSQERELYHPPYRSGIENLAPAIQDPFRLWYDSELSTYQQEREEKLKEGIDLNEITAFGIFAGYKPIFRKTGHYLNIVEPTSNVTGFGMGSKVAAQRFMRSGHGITTDEYRARLAEYRATAPVDPALNKAVADAKQRQSEAAIKLSQAEASKQQAINAQNQATAAYNTALNERDAAQTRLDNEQRKVDQALQARLQPLLKKQADEQKAVVTATNDNNEARRVYDQTEKTVRAKEQLVDGAGRAVADKTQMLTLANENLQRVQNAQPTFQQASVAVTTAQTAVAAKQTALDTATRELQTARQSLSTAQANLKAAEERLTSLLGELTAIHAYASKPENAKTLGAAIGAEQAKDAVAWQDFEKGRVYWTQAGGIVPVTNAFYSVSKANPWLGVATAREVVRPDGVSSQQFENGALVWQPGTGVQVTKGAIHAAWLNAGGANGSFGLPTSAEIPLGGSRVVQHFEGGDAYWAPGAGAWFVYRGNKVEWERLGGVNGYLGAPTGNEVDLGGHVVVQTFQGGRIYWSPQYGARAVHGGILAKYLTAGGHDILGVPTGGEYAVGAGVAQDFVKQVIRWP